MSAAPIILFVYNRPDHTLQTLQALEKNTLAASSELFIYSDAPKNQQSKVAVEQVREIIKSDWKFKKVHLILRDTNCGLAANVIDGVSAIVKKYGRIIVLEDDLTTSPFALTYFNDALERYQHENRVMQISGYGYPLKDLALLPETFFFRVANSWGWATWDRAWNHFNADINSLTDDFTPEQIHQFSIEGKENFWKQVQEFKSGKINSWAIRWYASVFKNNGLVLYPRNSLTQNIGNDGSGTHTAAESTYQVVLATEKITQFPEDIREHAQAYEAIKYFYAHRKGSLLNRAIRFAKKKFNVLKK
ncbi:glycosyltransferase family 2 protein [Sphingobacterium faecium]|uniref:glycosyltransferase family 2 protein n=1 Tax=Sphingobacterium faecium TaxID=34087 RepID=UPI00246858FE|nr:glycosyltransferase [Sphingobacterium faecium]MDH5828629.1 glycosyltransferase [Sphingobacterium faecium]